jgi:thymidine kinase
VAGPRLGCTVVAATFDRDEPGALSAVPDAGAEGEPRPTARLSFFYGPMDCGKSTLALQIDFNHARQGRRGLLLTTHDRSGGPAITTRVGLSRPAVQVHPDTDIRVLIRDQRSAGQRLHYLIVDEAGFLQPAHVDQLAELVDDWGVDVYCFGLLTDFRARLLPGAARLVELADELLPVQVEVLCWCGRPGLLNARVVDGVVARRGDTVVVADTAPPGGGRNTAGPAAVHYQVLCRAHHRRGELGPIGPAGQLTLDVEPHGN